MTDSELPGLLLAVRGKAAALVYDWELAERLFQKALTLSEISPEPLIRLSLVQGNREQAREIFHTYSARLPSAERELIELCLAPAPHQEVDWSRLKLGSAVEHLYAGLALHRYGRESQAEVLLHRYLESSEWGQELVEQLLLQDELWTCSMCEREKSRHFYGVQPVCPTCHRYLRDPDWLGQALHAPSSEQRKLLTTLHGEDISATLSGVTEAALPDFMRERAPLIQAEQTEKLLAALTPEMKTLVGGIKGELTASSLGQGLAGGIFDEELFTDLMEQKQFLEQCEKLDGQTDIQWLLCLANWNRHFSPPFAEQGITKRDLRVAYDFLLGRAGFRTRGLALMASTKMADEQHDYFEELVSERPDDLFLRSVLAEERLNDHSPERRRSRLRHQLWLVEHYPRAAGRFLWTPYTDDESSQQLVEAWVKKIESKQSDAAVLGSAASFFKLEEGRLAQALLLRCRQLEPDNPQWHEELAQVARFAEDKETELEALEAALQKTDARYRGSLLTSLALTAYDAGDYEKAKEVARELLLPPQSEEGWNLGNALHKGHTVLGLLALRNENIELAEHHLLQSAKHEGSPQLKSFGPNMRLADAVLKNGDKKVVLEFLDLCGEFWPSPQPEKWKGQIESGYLPDFGPNLTY